MGRPGAGAGWWVCLRVDASHGGLPHVLAGVDSEETGDGLAFAKQTGVGDWVLARDVGGRELSGLRDALEATPGMPVTAFYDSNGRLLHVQLGALSVDELRSQLSSLYHLSLP